MAIPTSDLKRLRLPGAIFLIMIGLGAASVWASLHLLKGAEKEFRETNNKRAEMKGKLARARDEEQELRDKIARYQDIVAKGYVGPERRLDWIETLGRIKSGHRLIDLNYDISPQRPVDASVLPGGAGVGSYELVASQMRIGIPLLHEGDLLNFLTDLRKSAPAMIQVRECEVIRIARGESDRAQRALLDAKCILEWVTFKERK